MKIFCSKKSKLNDEYYTRLAPATMVKRVGKYLGENLEGIEDVVYTSNKCDVYTTIMYQIKPEVRKMMKQYDEKFHGLEEEIYEMDLHLNITTYENAIRVYIIECDANERTLGYIKFTEKDLISLPACKAKLLSYIKKRVEKFYEKYEVLI